MGHNLSAWITEKLEQRGWSVREFGRRIGVSPSHASRVANGQVTPSFKLCNEIARAFEVRPQEVLALAGLIPPEPAEVAGEKKMLRLFRELPEGDRQDILQYAKFRQQSGSSRESVVGADRDGTKLVPSASSHRDEADPAIPIAAIAGDQQPISVQSVLESVAMRAIEEIGEEGEQALVDALLEVIKYRDGLKGKQPQDNQDENKEQ